ncbi:hypothetical protein MRB53_036899 [Persea americana]|nr:hypothetical protein MRB53_036899 [Persea americana]
MLIRPAYISVPTFPSSCLGYTLAFQLVLIIFNIINHEHAAAIPGPPRPVPKLCDRKYSEITGVASHNSAFYKRGTLSSNQRVDITTQLDDGVRMIQGETKLHHGVMKACHTRCILLDAGTLQKELTTVADWVARHPNDVVTILLANYDRVKVHRYISPITSSGLGPYLYIPPKIRHRYPMCLTNTLIVCSIRTTWNWLTISVWETPFSPTNISFPCNVHRPPGLPHDVAKDDFMYLANHNLNKLLAGKDVLVPSLDTIDQVNSVRGFGSIGEHAQTCAKEWGHPPNWLLVDYNNQQGSSVFEVAAKMNNVTYTGFVAKAHSSRFLGRSCMHLTGDAIMSEPRGVQARRQGKASSKDTSFELARERKLQYKEWGLGSARCLYGSAVIRTQGPEHWLGRHKSFSIAWERFALEMQYNNTTSFKPNMTPLKGANMLDIVREAPSGQLLRYITKNKYGGIYADEVPGWEYPALAEERRANEGEKKVDAATPESNTLALAPSTAESTSSKEIAEEPSRGDDTDLEAQHNEATLTRSKASSRRGHRTERFWSTDFITAIIMTYTFTVYIGSTIISPGDGQIVEHFGVSIEASSLALSLYVLAYGVALTPTFGGLLVSRFLLGFFGLPLTPTPQHHTDDTRITLSGHGCCFAHRSGPFIAMLFSES